MQNSPKSSAFFSKKVLQKTIIENQKSIVDGTTKCADFIKEMPVVKVEVQLKADVTENYFVKDLSYSVENGELVYGLRYEYKPSKVEEIFKLEIL